MYEKAMETCQCVRYKIDSCGTRYSSLDHLNDLIEIYYNKGVLKSDEKFEGEFNYSLFGKLHDSLSNAYIKKWEALQYQNDSSSNVDNPTDRNGTLLDLKRAYRVAKFKRMIDDEINHIISNWCDAAEAIAEGNIVQEFFRSNPTIELAGGTLTKSPGEDFYTFNIDFPLFGAPDLTDWQSSILMSKAGKLDNRNYQLSRKEVEFLLAEELKRKEGRFDMFLPRRAGDVKEKIESFSLRAFHDKLTLQFMPYENDSVWSYKWIPFAKNEQDALERAKHWEACPEQHIFIAPKEKCAELP